MLQISCRRIYRRGSKKYRIYRQNKKYKNIKKYKNSKNYYIFEKISKYHDKIGKHRDKIRKNRQKKSGKYRGDILLIYCRYIASELTS